MSEFFRALERAERERARRTEPVRTQTPPVEAVAAPAAVTEAPPAAPVAVADSAAIAAAVAAATVAASTVTVEEPRVVPPPEPPRPAPKPLTVAIGKATGTRPTGEVDEHLVSLITPDTFEADQYRVLRHTVEQRRRASGVAIVGITSAGPGDGKTTTAINLAGALAQDRNARVLLVDCDLRSSAMARQLGLGEGRGLVQAVIDPMLALEDATKRLTRFNLDVMAAGFETASPYELLKSPRLGDLFEAARRRYDYVVVDTPPAVPFPDCRVLAKIIDGFLLVVSAHKTPRRLVDEALEVLPREAVMGIVFNGEDQQTVRRYAGHYADAAAATPVAPSWRSSARRALTRVSRAS
jgi:protein-tyrosine kinase